jgi:hypothetical protein
MKMFENNLLRIIFGSTRKEVKGGWKKLYNQELHNLYSTNITEVIKSRRLSMAGYVVYEKCISIHML